MMKAGVGAHELRQLGAGEEAASAGDSLDGVLGEPPGMSRAEAFQFLFGGGTIGRIAGGHRLPIEGKVPLDAIAPLQFQVKLFHFLKKGGIVPRGAVEDGGGIAGSPHRAKILRVFFFGDILGLIDLQDDVGGVADDGRRFVGRKKYLASVAEADDVAGLGGIDAPEAIAVQAVLKAAHRDMRLGAEGRGALDGAAAGFSASSEQPGSEVSGDFVLAALAGHFDGKGQATVTLDTIEDSVGDFELVGVEKCHG